MKIKRFFSNDMRNVIRMVKEELGPDAVILSNSRVNGGIEVVAAVDYDETIFANRAGESSALNSGQNIDSEYTSAQSTHSRSEQAISAQYPQANSRAQETIQETITGKTAGKSAGKAAAVKSRADKSTLRVDKYSQSAPTLTADAIKQNRQYEQGSDFSFQLLDDDVENLSRVDETLYDASDVDPYAKSAKDNISAKGASEKNTASVWSQEPTLVDMRNEIRTLRGLLETQLTGLAWGDFARNNPVRAKLLRQLLELDIHPKLAGKIADAVGDYKDYEKAWQYALSIFTNKLPTINDDLIATGGIVSLIGPTGVGKTTTIAKLAARFALRHGRNNVALVTTDSFRIAAHEQLKTYGRILGMPMRIASNKEELAETLANFSDKDLVLIDTAGMSHRDMRLIEQFNMIADSAPSMKTLLVMSATTHRAGLDEIVRVFRNVELDGCVLTKIDETTNLAGSLSIAIEHQLPIAYIGNGQKVPEDLHLARAHSLVNQGVLIARKTNQPLENESLELAFSRVTTNVHV